jgi:hypothetical protein
MLLVDKILRKMIMKKLLILCFSILLVSCSATQSERNDMMRMSERQLCMEFMTTHTINRLQDDREDIIKSRRIDCWKYGNVAAERRKADADFHRPIIKPDPTPRSKTVCDTFGSSVTCKTY